MSDQDQIPPEEEPLSLEPEAEQEEEEPISLVDSDEAEGVEVKAFGAMAVGAGAKKEFKRSLNVTGQGATRCRMFYSKIARAALDYMETSINEWIDSEGIEVKHVGQTIGTMEGKRPEPNLIITVWY